MNLREIAGDRTGGTSAQIRDRVVSARQRQHTRFKDKPKITCYTRITDHDLDVLAFDKPPIAAAALYLVMQTQRLVHGIPS